MCFSIHIVFIMLLIYLRLVVDLNNYFWLHFSNYYMWFCVADSVQLRLCVSYWVDNNTHPNLFIILLNYYNVAMICYYYYLLQYSHYFIHILYYLFTHYYLILICHCCTYYVFILWFGQTVLFFYNRLPYSQHINYYIIYWFFTLYSFDL